MVDPYRVLGSVEPDLPNRCNAPPPPRCAFVPEPPRFPASIAAAFEAGRRRTPRLGRALHAAATLFLLTATASLSALTFTALRRHAQRQAQAAQQARSAITDPLTALGYDTHSVKALWARAERVAREGGPITLARARLPESAVADIDPALLHVVPEPGGGLRVIEIGEQSAAALAGLRAGDLVTTVNGFALRAPEDAARAFGAAGKARAAVAELWRNGRRVVLRVDWR